MSQSSKVVNVRTGWIGVWVSVAILALPGCADSSQPLEVVADDSAGPSPTVGRTADSPVVRRADGEMLLTCGSRIAFAASALAGGVDDLADADEVAAALDDLRAMAGIDAPEELQAHPASEARWMVLAGDRPDDPQRILVGLGRWDAATGPVYGRSQTVTLERDGDGWKAHGWGGCKLRPALPVDTNWVEIRGVRGGLDPDSTKVEVEVSELECTSGRDPSPFLREPLIIETDDAVTVYWTSEAPKGGGTCPGNPQVRRTIQLDKPTGVRHLLDGSSWPPAPVRDS